MLLALVPACFDPAPELRGQPCTTDASCGTLSCSYGFCGGPPRCEAGASVGDYCFVLDEDASPIAGAPRSIAVGRVDVDPFPDVATVAADGRASLLVNDGMGGLAPAIESTAIAAGPSGLGIGDVDGGGWHELVISTDDGRVVILPVQDTGFAAPVTAASGLTDPALPTVGNFYADLQGGIPDIAVLVGDGMEVVPQSEPLAFDATVYTYVDTPSDIATTSADGAFALVARRSQSDIQVLERGLDGHYTPLHVIDVGGPPARFVLADLDGDAYGDILSADEAGKLWLTSAKTASPQTPEDWAMPREVYALGFVPQVLSVGNLDDDDDVELIVARPEGDVYLFDNDGDGVPLYGGSLGVAAGNAVAVGELEGDGVPEIMVASEGPDVVRIARRTVAPPPPGDMTTGESGPAPETGVDTLESTTDDPTIDPTDDPTNVEVGEEGPYPECPYYQLDWLCFGIVQAYPHEFQAITVMTELRGIQSAQLWGYVDQGGEPFGVAAALIGLDGQGTYELQMLQDIMIVPTGVDIGFVIEGSGSDAVVTFADGLVVLFGDDQTVDAFAPGQNLRDPVITDIADDAFADIIVALDGGVGLVRGSALHDGSNTGSSAPVEIFELGGFSDLDRVPLLAPTPALAMGAAPFGDAVLGIGSDGLGGLAVVTSAALPNTGLAAFGNTDAFGAPFLVGASTAQKAPQMQLAYLDGVGGEWFVAPPLGSADGIVHDIVTVDLDLDGGDDVLAMFDDGTGRRIDVWLWRGDGFEQVASMTDVPEAYAMLPVSRGELGWELLVADPTHIWVYGQVFIG